MSLRLMDRLTNSEENLHGNPEGGQFGSQCDIFTQLQTHNFHLQIAHRPINVSRALKYFISDGD